MPFEKEFAHCRRWELIRAQSTGACSIRRAEPVSAVLHQSLAPAVARLLTQDHATPQVQIRSAEGGCSDLHGGMAGLRRGQDPV